MIHKPFKNYDEQIELLRSKGLIIEDPEFARKFLTHLNYYRLSGYSLTLRKNDKFYPNVSFENIMQIYHFDKELKSLLMRYLEDIEIALRSHIAYELGKLDSDENSEISYRRVENFASEAHFEQFSSDLITAHKDARHEPFVKHHDRKYSGRLPVWAMVETLSFGSASRLFSSLSVPLQKQICDEYYSGMRYTIIENWLEGLVVLRNLCAHHARLFNRGIVYSPSFSSEDNNFFEEQGYERNQIGNKLFFRLIIVARLSPLPNIKEALIADISALSDKYPFVDLSHYGFLPNWVVILNKCGTLNTDVE